MEKKAQNVSCLCSVLQLLRRRPSAAEEDLCDVPIGIRIRTARDSTDLMNPSSSSPVSKTPTLVARLMGLESISSESNSPSISLSNPKRKSVFGDFVFVVPESSRRSLDSISVSSSPKRSSKQETEHFHHRRSLQIPRQKENVGSTLSGRRRRRVSSHPPPEENRRRKHLVDITNRNSPVSPHKRSNPRKPGKKSPPGAILRSSESNPDENKRRRREKRSPNSPQSLVPVKKIPSTKLPHKQVEACAALSRKKKTESRYRTSHYPLFLQSGDDGGAGTSTAAVECKRYIGRILQRAGLLNSFRRPLCLNPSIFHYLELFPGVAGGDLRRRCDRRLIFDLVDEILAGARFDSKKWVGFAIDGSEVIDAIWKKIEKLPAAAAAKCGYIGDVDGLIESDIDGRRRWDGMWREESERVACEIEAQVVDSLIDETVAVVDGARTKKKMMTRRGKVRRRVARTRS